LHCAICIAPNTESYINTGERDFNELH